MRTKRIINILFLMLLAGSIFTQIPGFNYQAVLRSVDGEPMPNSDVKIFFNLTDGPDGPVLYRESQSLTTNELGMVNTVVGTGNVEMGTFADIVSVQNLNIKLQAELPGEPNIVDVGFGIVGAVPYALYGEDADADPENEMQSLTLQGDSLKITKMGGVSVESIGGPWKMLDDGSGYFFEIETPGQRSQDGKTVFQGCNGQGVKDENGVVIAGECHEQVTFDQIPATLREVMAQVMFDAGVTLPDGSIFDKVTQKPENTCSYSFYTDERDYYFELINGELGFDLHDISQTTGNIFASGSYSLLGDVCKYTIESQWNALPESIRQEINRRLAEFEGKSNPFPDNNSFEVTIEKRDPETTVYRISILDEDDKDLKIDFLDQGGYYSEWDIKKFPDQYTGQSFAKDGQPTAATVEELSDELSCSGHALGSSKIDLGVDANNPNKRAPGDPVTFINMISETQFGAGAVVSPQGPSGDFAGTFSTANKSGLTTLSGAVPGIDPTNGFDIVFNGQNFGVVSTNNSESAGTTSTYGVNGALNTTAGTFAGTPNDGVFMVFGADGVTPAAYMRNTASGSEVAANNITMLTSPPGRSNQTAAFSVPMGAEAAAYDRGTAQMVNGEATVVCPEHFQWVADEASMTVIITPLSAESKGVAVIEKSNGGFKVKELYGGTGNYSFDYLVMCKRKGYEDFQVVRKKPELARDQNSEILQHLPKGPMKSIRDLVKKSD